MVNFYIYYNIYIHKHIHIYIYIYIFIFINIKNSGKPETVHRYWPVSEIYRTGGQTGTASGTVLTSLMKSPKSLSFSYHFIQSIYMYLLSNLGLYVGHSSGPTISNSPKIISYISSTKLLISFMLVFDGFFVYKELHLNNHIFWKCWRICLNTLELWLWY